jgi:hypothetical protein
MERLLSNNVWAQLPRSFYTSSGKRAALAYVSRGDFLSFGEGDVLICDASNAAIKSGQTSASVLKEFRDRGADLYHLDSLHAKVAVAGGTALVGSCNLSESSAEHLTEAALLTDDSRTVAKVLALVDEIRRAAVRVDDRFLQRILKLKVTKRVGSRATGRKRKRITQPGSRVWIVRVYPLSERTENREAAAVEVGEGKAREVLGDPDAELSYLRWTGTARFRRLAQKGDVIIQIWSERSAKRVHVYPPRPLIHRQDTKRWTRFYYQDADETDAVSWTHFQRHIGKLGITNVRKNSVRELSQRDFEAIRMIWAE